jgi:hypothetical protein
MEWVAVTSAVVRGVRRWIGCDDGVLRLNRVSMALLEPSANEYCRTGSEAVGEQSVPAATDAGYRAPGAGTTRRS